MASNFFSYFNKDSFTIKPTKYSCLPLKRPLHKIVMLSNLRGSEAGNLTSRRATESLLYSLITEVMFFRAPCLYENLVSTFKIKILQVSSFNYSNFIF